MSAFKKPVNALTLRANGIAKVITSALDVFISDSKNSVRVSGIWDTGATGTAITQHLVGQLGLVATGKRNVETANGRALQDTYMIDVGLPNNVVVRGIEANAVPSLPSDNEVLIGMDIITLGDFSITHYKGKTCMSFRVPSLHEIDYSKNLHLKVSTDQPKTVSMKVGRNDKCPCGSGKKYKHCCGNPANKK